MESEQRRKAAYPLTKVVFVTAGNKNVESIFLLLPVDCGKAMIIVFIMCFKQGSIWDWWEKYCQKIYKNVTYKKGKELLD